MLGVVALAIVTVLVLVSTGPGHRFATRLALKAIRNSVNGQVTIGSLDGSLWHTADLHDVTFTGADGRQVIHAERAEVSYAIVDLLRSRFIFNHVVLVRPVVTLERGKDRVWNFERLFKLKTPRLTRVTSSRPLIVLTNASVIDGTLTVRDLTGDTAIEHGVARLNTELLRLRISHPDSTPVEATIASIAASVRNPDVELEKADGVASIDGDSLRFTLDHVTLPNTAAAAAGRLRWDGPRTVIDVAVNARRFAFADVRGLVPSSVKLPEGGGSVALHLRLLPSGASEYDVRDADIRSGRSLVSGRARVTMGAKGDVALAGMDLALRPLDLALPAFYAGPLPVRGLVTGRVRGTGPLRALTVDGDLRWSDEAVPGAPTTAVKGRGRLELGGAHGLVFDAFTLDRGDIDGRTLQHLVTSVNLDGHLIASGSLDGPWRDASFRGQMMQVAGPLASGVHGSLRLGLLDTTRIDADLDLDSLSLDLLSHTYPSVPKVGTVRGRARLHGPMSNLAVDADLRGLMGKLMATGTIGVADSSVHVALGGTFDSLDLHRVRPAAPPSQLAGTWGVDIIVPVDSTKDPSGTMRASLLPGLISGVYLNGGGTALRLDAARVQVDSFRLDFAGGRMQASGALGRDKTLPNLLTFNVRADTAAYVEPLVLWLARASGDSSLVRFDGGISLEGKVEGTTSDYDLTYGVRSDAIAWGSNFGRGMHSTGHVVHDAHGYLLNATFAADSLQALGMAYTPVGIAVQGPAESLTVRVSAGFQQSSALRASLTISGDSAERRIWLDVLDLDVPVRSWRLRQTARIAITPSAIRVDTLELRPRSGPGLLRASGVLPRTGTGDFEISADSIAIASVYSILQKDTAGVSGTLNGSVRLTGRAETPVIDLRAALVEGRFGEYRLPLVQLTSHYNDHRLTIDGEMSRRSEKLITVTGSLPIDLSLTSVANRELPGSINIVAHSDSMDMTILRPLLASVTDLSGVMALDMRVGGTWDDPSFAGYVDITNASLGVPSMGARYSGIDARFVLSNNRFQLERATIGSAHGGTLALSGQVLFDKLTKPVLDLHLVATRFAAFDIHGFGALTATGDLTLRGPLLGATLSGNMTVDDGYLQFRDLVEKRVVSLDDPEFRALVDSTLQGEELRVGAHAVFFDSLQIANLSVTMGPDVWLRSSEANIQLGGDVTVQRALENGAQRYRVDGTLHALRGTYRLSLGKENSIFAISRDFRVTRGTVRFFGTPDFNPELDIAAEHVVRTQQRSELVIRVLIGGTLMYPELRLESDQRPPLSETEIVSYLMFGQPPSALANGAAGRQSETAIAQAVGSSIVGGVGQALVSELGLPLDYLTVVPGEARSGNALGVGAARVEAGAQLGERTFLTLNAGVCEVLTARAVGAALEYRLSGRWSATASFEPVIQECGTSSSLAGLTTRQFGFDLFWQTGIR